MGTFGSQVSIDKRSHGVYKELSSWVLAVYRSKQESKSWNFNQFQSDIPIANDWNLHPFASFASGHLLLFKEWFNILLEAFHVSTLQRKYLIAIPVSLTDPLSTPAAAEIVAVTVHVRLLLVNVLSSLLVSARRSHSLLLWQ